MPLVNGHLGGAIVEVAGFFLLAGATSLSSLLVGLAVIVTGFAFVNPSLNSLLSRRSDPARQGGILGIGQSISSLARILADEFRADLELDPADDNAFLREFYENPARFALPTQLTE